MREEKHNKKYKAYYDNKQTDSDEQIYTNECVLTGLHAAKILKKEKKIQPIEIPICAHTCVYVVRAYV